MKKKMMKGGKIKKHNLPKISGDKMASSEHTAENQKHGIGGDAYNPPEEYQEGESGGHLGENCCDED